MSSKDIIYFSVNNWDCGIDYPDTEIFRKWLGEDEDGELGVYDLINLIPELKFKDGPVEFEVTVRLIENIKEAQKTE